MVGTRKSAGPSVSKVHRPTPTPVAAAANQMIESSVETAVEEVAPAAGTPLDELAANQQASLNQLVAMNEDLVNRLRQCVSAMQIAQMLVGEVAKGDASTMSPRPDLQQVLDVLNSPIVSNYHLSRGMQPPA